VKERNKNKNPVSVANGSSKAFDNTKKHVQGTLTWLNIRSTMQIFSICTFILLSITVDFNAYSQTAEEIIEKADAKMRGTSSQSIMKMTVVRPDWTREVTMKGWSHGTKYSLILITAPARDKGQAFLKRKKEMWNWQPTIDRVIKMPPSMMLQSWMGSDFTNDDLVKESSIVHDYTHELEKDTTINGLNAYKIVLIPKPDAPVVWGKIVAYVDEVEYNQLLVYYYDEDDFLINTLTMSKIKEMGGKVIPTLLEMVPAEEPENKTVIEYLNLEFDIDINENFFSLQNTKRVR
jgi:outer membrane lipoprotein-sorting protein